MANDQSGSYRSTRALIDLDDVIMVTNEVRRVVGSLQVRTSPCRQKKVIGCGEEVCAKESSHPKFLEGKKMSQSWTTTRSLLGCKGKESLRYYRKKIQLSISCIKSFPS